MKTTMVIPAKGHSERVHNKNLYKINGKTLVEIACERALNCQNISEVYLDTESEDIKLHIRHLLGRGLKIIDRPKELATNRIGANEMLIYALHMVEDTDLLLQSFATSPIITSQTIDRCIEEFLNSSDEYDSFFTTSTMKEYLWSTQSNPMNFDIKELPNSQTLEPIYVETHGLYGILVSTLLESKTRIGKKPLLIPISKKESFDIDDWEDIEIVSRLLKEV